MKIAIVGPRGAGTSFIVDNLAQLLVAEKKQVHCKDASASKSIYKKYLLKKQIQTRTRAEPLEGYVVDIHDPFEEDVFDVRLYDLSMDVPKEKMDHIFLVTDLDACKFKDIIKSLEMRGVSEGEKISLIVNRYVGGKVHVGALTAEMTMQIHNTFAVDFDMKSCDLDLYGRMTGAANVHKFSKVTRRQLQEIMETTLGLKQKKRWGFGK